MLVNILPLFTRFHKLILEVKARSISLDSNFCCLTDLLLDAIEISDVTTDDVIITNHAISCVLAFR